MKVINIIPNTTIVEVYVDIARKHNVSLLANDTSTIVFKVDDGVYIILFQKGDNVYMFGTKKLVDVSFDTKEGDIYVKEEEEKKEEQQEKKEQKQQENKETKQQNQQQEKKEQKQQENKETKQQDNQQQEKKEEKQQENKKTKQQNNQQQEKEEENTKKYEFYYYSLDLIVFKTKYGLGLRKKKDKIVGWVNYYRGNWVFNPVENFKDKELINKIDNKLDIIIYQAKKEGLIQQQENQKKKPKVIPASYEYRNGRFKLKKDTKKFYKKYK